MPRVYPYQARILYSLEITIMNEEQQKRDFYNINCRFYGNNSLIREGK